jgi:predicted DNA-binding transcriptional regulator AlpA
MNVLPPISGGSRPGAVSPGAVAAAAQRAEEARPRGRPVTAGNQANEVNRLRAQGLRAVEIAAHLGIGRASVYRILSQGQTVELPRPERTDERDNGLSARIVGRFAGVSRV